MASQPASDTVSGDPVGVVAGGGRLPVLLLQSLRVANRPAVVVCVCKQPEPELQQLAIHFQQISPGQLRKIIKVLHQRDVREVVFIGSVDKKQVFRPQRFDMLALKALSRNRKRGDRALLQAIAEIFEESGLKVLDQRTYLSALLPQPGCLTRKQLNESAEHDARLGIQLAQLMAVWDIGQTVVIRDGVVVAVEAVEGTNATIQRAAELAGKGIVVAKAAHPQHDFRFDVPTVGPETLELLRDVGGAAIAIEAERAFLVDREAVLATAEAAGIAVAVIRSDSSDTANVASGRDLS